MRTHIVVVAAAALFALPAPVLAQEVEVGPGGVEMHRSYRHYRHPRYEGRSVYRGECGELRQACMHKEELGETGAGNCRRYREMCRGR